MPSLITIQPVGGVSPQARFLVLGLAVALSTWVISKIRHRKLLVPTSTLLFTVAFGTIAFAAFPRLFDHFSFLLGIHYPPILYLLLAILGLMLVVLHLALRLSVVDERCRKLAQVVTLLETSRQDSPTNSV